MSYELDSVAVVTNFAHYIEGRGLPRELFNNPDYIALQAGSITDFGDKIRQAEPQAEQITITEADSRFVASIKLVGLLGVAQMGRVNWLEVLEPTEDEMWLGLGSDRVGFYYADFEKARAILGSRGVQYSIDDDPAPAIRVAYTETGVNGEFTLSKYPFGAIVEEDIQANKVTFVKRAA